jgi:hypothetical protein
MSLLRNWFRSLSQARRIPAPRPRRHKGRGPRLEELESRTLLSVTAHLSGGELVVTGDNSGNTVRADVIPDGELTRERISYLDRGNWVVVGLYFCTSLRIDSGAGDDTVNVDGALAQCSLITINGDGGHDVVNLNSFAPGTVNVLNPPGYTDLNVTDPDGAVSATATVGLSSLTLAHPAHNFTYVVNYTPADLSRLDLDLGDRGNTVTVNDTPFNGRFDGLVTTVRGGSGVDTMNVLRTTAGPLGTARLVLDGNGGLDNVNIGNAGSLAGILAPIDVSNPPAGGYTALTIDTRAFTGTYTATVSDTAISFDGGVPIRYLQRDLRSLTLHGGSGNNTYNITNTPSSTFPGGVVTTVNAGGGDDIFYVLGTAAGATTTLNGGNGYASFVVGGDGAGQLSSIAGRLRLDGQAGGGRVWVNDFGGDEGRTFTLNGSSLSWDTVTWGTVTVEAANVATFEVTGGQGDDTYRVQGTNGAFLWSLDNAGGTNTLIGPGTPNTWSLTAGAAHSYLGADVAFRADQIQNLVGGSDYDTFVFSDGFQIAGTIDGGAGTNTLNYAAYTSDVYVNLVTGVATGVGAGISNIQNVTGASGGPAGSYNILVGNGGNVLTGGTGRRNLLIAGASASTLLGGDDDDILIGGTAAYDTDRAALLAIMAEWTRTDEDCGTRVFNLTHGVGVPLLDATTVSGNGGGNTLLGRGGCDWYFGNLDLDTNDWNPATGTFTSV